MKNLFKIITILLLLTTIFSCSKDESKPTIYPEENPMQGILTKTGFNQVSPHLDYPSTEFGFSFKPSVKGKINAFVVKIPSSNSNIRATLWDVATKTVIRTEVIEVTNANSSTTKTIIPIELTINKEYLLSINTNQYYDYFEINDAVANYPLAINNIVITNCSFLETSNQTFPTISLDTEIFGDISFNFQRTE